MVLGMGARMIFLNTFHNPSSDSVEGSESNIAVGTLEASVVLSNCLIIDRKSDPIV